MFFQVTCAVALAAAIHLVLIPTSESCSGFMCGPFSCCKPPYKYCCSQHTGEITVFYCSTSQPSKTCYGTDLLNGLEFLQTIEERSKRVAMEVNMAMKLARIDGDNPAIEICNDAFQDIVKLTVSYC